jgi:hypothetical protein
VKRMRLQGEGLKLGFGFQPQLKVIEYISTQKGDEQRGPMVRISSGEARFRLLEDGELVWVSGPRRNELAVLEIDDSVGAGHAVLRDIAGVAVSESVTVTKPDTDTPVGKRHFG